MKPTFSSMTAILLGAILLKASALGDTIVLTNGNKIDGTIVADERASGGKLVLGVEGGTMFFRASEVADVQKGAAAAAAAAAGNFVEVRLTKGNVFYGSGSYFGRISPQSNDETLVLEIPDVGKITIPRSAVASIEEIEGTSPDLIGTGLAKDESPKPAEISTTHAIYMKNGRKLIGSVIPTPEEEPVKVQIGHLGVLTISRKDIDRIAEEAGTIPLPPEKAETEKEPEPEAVPLPDSLEALKEQIKAELLRELLQELLDVRVGVLLEEAAVPDRGLVTTRTTFDGEEEIGVQEVLRDLTRNRTQYRVRAENRLRELGPPVLPYLRSLVHHPFELTRRAVQRIARDIGVRESVPIAIDALNDEDVFVREIAHQTLKELLPDVGIAYHPRAGSNERGRAQADYWHAWDQERVNEARQRLLDRLARRG